jgi:hypothetical protein
LSKWNDFYNTCCIFRRHYLVNLYKDLGESRVLQSVNRRYFWLTSSVWYHSILELWIADFQRCHTVNVFGLWKFSMVQICLGKVNIILLTLKHLWWRLIFF